jgi:radical SAM/Cys-rich protein
MLDTLPRLKSSDFPLVHRGNLETLQVNMGYRCNQQCLHCHVAAGPRRSEAMSEATLELVIEALDTDSLTTLDLTGGAPELNPGFRRLVIEARSRGLRVIDRCNLTVLLEPDQQGLAEFLARHQVEVAASLPCYLEENVDRQRGKGVFANSIAALRRLNGLGYGDPDGGLPLDLVYNPQRAVLPPVQTELEADYKRVLMESYGIRFNRLLVLADLPIGRFGSGLISRGEFDNYMALLKQAHKAENLPAVMCRSLISVDWRGYLFDCDFNQMLGLHLDSPGNEQPHLRELSRLALQGKPVRVADHCFGCTAGQGSSCGGALLESRHTMKGEWSAPDLPLPLGEDRDEGNGHGARDDPFSAVALAP